MTLSAGFFGKIPSRGDFVRHGLPPDFLAALDLWWQAVLPASRARLGEAWTAAWMVAPIWRFAFPPGCCGAGAAAGLWLPSTDKAGRLFPLTIALVGPAPWGGLAHAGAFLDAAEAAGLRALEQDLSPAELAAGLAGADRPGGEMLEAPAPGLSRWWTDGSPLVAPATRHFTGLPSSPAFTAMIQDEPPA